MIENLQRILIHGAGMMGASLAIALRKHPQFVGKILATVRTERSAHFLRQENLVDEVRVNLSPDELQELEPDFAVLATPVQSMVQMLPLLRLVCPVTDMGSTRMALEQVSRSTDLKFVGSHPMCGSENSGPEALVADLFQNRLCIIIDGLKPGEPDRDETLVQLIEAFWSGIGMRTFRLDAETHDRIVAGLSHGPHFLSSALALSYRSDEVLLEKNDESPCAITGGGLRDMLRIAGSNPVMWRDILATNRLPILSFLKAFRSELDGLIQKTEEENTDWVIPYQEEALQVRNRIYGTNRNDERDRPTPMHRPRILSLDGPAGSGKSSVAGILASRLGYLHADSGALYRSLTYACMTHLGAGNSPEEFGEEFQKHAPDPDVFDLHVEYTNGKQLHFLNGKELGLSIRSADVTGRIRFIADHSVYRKRVNELLRELGTRTSLVVDGRDIGTVVFPETPYKFYLDAAVRTRAERRLKELKDAGMEAPSIETLEKQIEERDEQDRNRKIGSLQIPVGAILIDTSHIDRDMVVSGILAHLQEKF